MKKRSLKARESLAKKIALIATIVLAMIFVADTWHTLHASQTERRALLETRAVLMTEMMAEAMSGSLLEVDIDVIDAQLKSMERYPDFQFALVAGYDNAILSTQGSPITDGILVRRPIRSPHTAELLGFVETAFSVDSLRAALWREAGNITLRNSILWAIVLGFVFLLLRHISAPLNELERAVAAFGEGERSKSIPGVERRDEIGALAKSFAEMARQLNSLLYSLERQVKERTADLESAKIEAEQANRAKSEFLANMSHEIRTPLNGVLGMAQVLQACPLSESQREMVGVIVDSGDALLRVINDILDLSKVEAGQLDIVPQHFDLVDLSQRAENLFLARAQQKDLSLSFNIDADAEGVYIGDATRIRQVLHNLLSNAIKFTETGGVTVTVSRREKRKDQSDALIFSVADTGPGIAPAKQDLVFEAFRQADESSTREHGGTGLGLTICRRICELMGGWIRVDSTMGEGSTFTFAVAVRAAPSTDSQDLDAIQTQTTDLTNAGQQGVLRILAAEDNEINRIVLKTMLAHEQLQLTIVNNGQEAIDAWSTGVFDLLLLDVCMPVLDGVAATRQIREQERLQNLARTPVISVSANAMQHQVEEYLAAGADAVVSKPIDPSDLFGAIAELSKSSPRETRNAVNG